MRKIIKLPPADKRQKEDKHFGESEEKIKERFKDNDPKRLKEGFIKILKHAPLLMMLFGKDKDYELSKKHPTGDYLKKMYPEKFTDINHIWKTGSLPKGREESLKGWNGEGRSPERLALDVVSGWLSEDCVKKIMELICGSKGYKIERNGSDKGREYISANKATMDPDLVMINSEEKRGAYIEVMEDLSGWVVKNGTLDLRWTGKNQKISKYENLKKMASGKKRAVYLAILDIEHCGLILIDIEDTEVAKDKNGKDMIKFEHPNYGDRCCTKIKPKDGKSFGEYFWQYKEEAKVS